MFLSFFLLLTDETAVELGSHGDVLVPGPHVNSDIPSPDGGNYSVRHHCVSITVTREYLHSN